MIKMVMTNMIMLIQAMVLLTGSSITPKEEVMMMLMIQQLLSLALHNSITAVTTPTITMSGAVLNRISIVALLVAI